MAYKDVITSLHTYHGYPKPEEGEGYVQGTIRPGKYAMLIDGEPRIVTIDGDGNAVGELVIWDQVLPAQDNTDAAEEV
jgi:hypothetical protein